MKVEQNQYAQVIFIDKSDIVEEEHYNYLRMIAVGCSPSAGVDMFRTILVDPTCLVDGKHVIFLVNEKWNKLTSNAKKAFMDHEFGHIADGQLDSEEAKQAAGGVVVKLEWEYAADDFSVAKNGKETMYMGLLEGLKLFSRDPLYLNRGIDLTEDVAIQKRLARLKPETETA